MATIADQLHVRSGVLSYPGPTFAGQPWWVFPEFAVAVAVMALSYGPATRMRELPESDEVPEGLLWFFGVYLASCLLDPWPIALVVLFVVSFAWRAGTRALGPSLPFVLGIALMGPAVEATLVSLGLFSYGRPHATIVPPWLPALYLHAAWTVRAVALRYLVPPDRNPTSGSAGIVARY